MDIVGVEIDSNNFPDQKQQEFLTLKEYLAVAKRALRYFLVRLRPDLVESVCDDEDVISNIAYALMIADWKWNENGGRTKSSFRMNYAWYAVRSYIARRSKYRSRYGKIISIDEYDGDDCRNQFLDEKQVEPLNIIIGSQFDEDMKKLKKYLGTDILTPREKYCIRQYYFKEKTLKEIGETIDISKERVRQLLKGATGKMREHVQTKN